MKTEGRQESNCMSVFCLLCHITLMVVRSLKNRRSASLPLCSFLLSSFLLLTYSKLPWKRPLRSLAQGGHMTQKWMLNWPTCSLAWISTLLNPSLRERQRRQAPRQSYCELILSLLQREVALLLYAQTTQGTC